MKIGCLGKSDISNWVFYFSLSNGGFQTQFGGNKVYDLELGLKLTID